MNNFGNLYPAFCPECGIGLTNSEKRLGFCFYCKAHWEPEQDTEEAEGDEDDEEDQICDVCRGGGDSSGPYYCWRCKGTHIVKPPKRIER